MNLPASSPLLFRTQADKVRMFRYAHASLVRSHKDSDLWLVVSVPAPKKGGMIEALSTRFTVGVPAEMADLVEGDVCRLDGAEMQKCGSLS